MDTLRLPARIESLEPFRSYVVKKVAQVGASQDAIFKIELILEELLTNIIKYAYRKGSEGDIEIGCSIDDNKLCISIGDWGCPFDPLSKIEPDICQDVSDRNVGGLGIFLARKFMSELKYERDSGKNLLMFCFEL